MIETPADYRSFIFFSITPVSMRFSLGFSYTLFDFQSRVLNFNFIIGILFSLFTFHFHFLLFTFYFLLFTFHFLLFTFYFSLFTFHFSHIWRTPPKKLRVRLSALSLRYTSRIPPLSFTQIAG